MMTISLALIFGSVFLGVLAACSQLCLRPATEEEQERKASCSPLVRFLLLAIRPLLPLVAGNRLDPFRSKIAPYLERAGDTSWLTPDEFMAINMLSLCGFPLLISTCFPVSLPLLLAAVLVGGTAPAIWIHERLTLRRRRILARLPYALDLVTLSVEAGLDFGVALARIAAKQNLGPLGVELSYTVQEMRMGRTRRQALRHLSERLAISEVNSLAVSLIQADELGSSLGDVLRSQAEGIRIRRSQQAEKRALEAPTKLLIPLVCFIFPAIFLILLAPILLQLLESPY